MKRFFRMLLIAIVLLVMTAGASPGVSFAEDVWVYTYDEDEYPLDVYLDTNKISVDKREPQYQGLLKFVFRKEGSLANFYPAGFALRNGKVVGFTFSRSQGYWEFHGPVGNHEILNAVWHVMKPYLKDKGVSGVDDWN